MPRRAMPRRSGAVASMRTEQSKRARASRGEIDQVAAAMAVTASCVGPAAMEPTVSRMVLRTRRPPGIRSPASAPSHRPSLLSRSRTKVWVIVIGEIAYIRTNDSRWLENIQRDSNVLLNASGTDEPFLVEISDDEATYDRVEAAFKEKYGFMQSVMSAFRIGRPTVLRLTAR